jgi:hypothetical protein
MASCRRTERGNRRLKAGETPYTGFAGTKISPPRVFNPRVGGWNPPSATTKSPYPVRKSLFTQQGVKPAGDFNIDTTVPLGVMSHRNALDKVTNRPCVLKVAITNILLDCFLQSLQFPLIVSQDTRM